jgi:uncharacterized protein (TIGR03437 family)
VPVTLVVSRQLPQLNVNPATLTFAHTPGGTPPTSQSVQVTSSGDPINFTAAATTATGGNWLSVSPASGATPAALTVSVTPGTLTAGTYNGTITLTSSGAANSPRTIAVTLTIAAVAAPVISEFLNGATLRPSPAAPGLIVTLKGANLGPTPAVGTTLTAEGTVATIAGGTRALFDGIAAGPILYASSQQVNAVVPYSIAGRVSTRVQIEYRGVLSNPLEVRIVDAQPGIFTLSSSGTGLGAILNQDNTLNGTGNAAPRGSVIAVYATGEGQTTPGGVDGQVPTATTLKRPVLQPVRAFIGGVECAVQYAGSAPGAVSGAMQINILVGENVPTGTPAITFSVGSFTSPPGVTVAIR